ncbi:MAG: carbamoyl-phosphate synthase large subunit, partial [Actinoallomurus sp.]
ADAGVPILGTPPEAIDAAEDRGQFGAVLDRAGLPAPAYGTATTAEQAFDVARRIGFPVLVRPSFVLGGRDMRIVYTEDELAAYMTRVAAEVSKDKPVLIDQFLENATEVDVDCLSDGTRTAIGGVMQHIEEAGIHSGDSACVIPPHSLPAGVIAQIKEQARKLAAALNVRGLMNIQFAVTGLRPDGLASAETPEVYILEANPRASRTIPFVSKATGVPLAKAAARIMLGATIADLRAAGYDTVMVNCNPETVSTDYDTSSRLYFEPLTLEDVLEVVHAEQETGEVAGVIVQLGGQTPLGLAQQLKDAGVPVVGTSPESIHLAEERGAFGQVLARAGLPAPKHGTATSYEEAAAIAAEIGYPVLVRPSYVLGGRGMEIVYDEATLKTYIDRAGGGQWNPEHPVLVDRFLDEAIEIDVDALYDGEELYLGGVMEHIEEAGIHSGDSACALPPITLGREDIDRIRTSTEALAREIGVRGLMNVQYALSAGVLYVLEANPRASRTVPFVSKATAVPLAKAAARVMMGESIARLRAEGVLPATGDGGHLPLDAPISVKEAVLPFDRFRTPEGVGVDTILGPEMRSTGEVMGIDTVFGTAYAKSQISVYGSLPTKGRAFVSVANRDKRAMIFPVKRLADLGFEILATEGTAEVLRRNGVRAKIVRKHSAGPGPDGEPTIVRRILDGEVDLIVNTPFGSPGQSGPRLDGYEIRTAAVLRGVPCLTTVQALGAAVQGIEASAAGVIGVRSLQEHAQHLWGGEEDS